MQISLTKTIDFEAAHWLPTFPEGHKCRRLHGHSFKIDIIIAGEVDPAKGFLQDFGEVKEATGPLLPERHRGLGKPDRRDAVEMDLRQAQANTAPARRRARPRDLHQQRRVQRVTGIYDV
jgi:6-pyruvoyl tetrahydropterin synthase/QueD family protein